jgi:signal transduction histidine kinase
MRLNKAFLLILLISLVSNFALAKDNTINVVENEYVYGGSKISKYSGSINTTDYNEVLPEISQFKPFKTNFHSDAPSNQVNWIYFELANPDNVDLWINFGSSRLNEIRIFRLDEHQSVIDTIESGFDIGKDYRPLGSFKFSMPILARDIDDGKFLVSYYSKSGLQETFICFGTQNQIAEEAFYGSTYTVLFMGGYVILFFYNLMLFFSLKDKIYLFYALSLVSNFLAATFAVNFQFMGLILGEEVAQTYMGCWIWILPLTMTIFTIQFFELKKSSPFWYRFIIVVFGLNVANAFGMLFVSPHISSGLAMILLVLFYTVCSLIGYDQIRKKHPLAVIYFVSWLLVLCSVILYFVVAQLGFFYSAFGHYGNYITGTIEAVLFSVALGRRYQLILEEQKKTAALLEKKNANLVLANDALDSFNYHVSHDLKSILVNTVSLNQMIKKYTLNGKSDKVIQISERLNGVAEKGKATIKGFLALAEAGKLKEGTKENVQIKSAIAEIIETNGIDNLIVEYGTLEFDSISFIPVEFNSIFLNLLTNSKKYTSQSPKVSISLKLTDNHAQIIYSDNGIGVDLEKNGKSLFAPFKRLDNNLNQEGTGVGLSLVKRIINEYGGTIVPHSEPNKGLTFVISFPKTLLSK